jgi:hypothetical protein
MKHEVLTGGAFPLLQRRSGSSGYLVQLFQVHVSYPEPVKREGKLISIRIQGSVLLDPVYYGHAGKLNVLLHFNFSDSMFFI